MQIGSQVFLHNLAGDPDLTLGGEIVGEKTIGDEELWQVVFPDHATMPDQEIAFYKESEDGRHYLL